MSAHLLDVLHRAADRFPDRTLALALERTGVDWSATVVGVLGHGSIGRAVLELAIDRLGPPRDVLIRDPRRPDSAPSLDGTGWILGAWEVPDAVIDEVRRVLGR